ncbi:fructosamine-3-kinase [Flavobacteriaceae bacterium MAR_2009_75]|nr:fructosamine-3-kinase [Flavobacteriaceae bacterium MAR_2009_75]
MDNSIRKHIECLLCTKIIEIRPISGGDISQAYMLKTEIERFFCKIHQDQLAFKMFQAERSGLKALRETKTIGIPKVLLCEPLEEGALLIMEFVETKTPTSFDFERLGHQLATLHRSSEAKKFGYAQDNFTGSLSQSNHQNINWVDFYVSERLLPQLRLAQDSGKLLSSEIPSETLLSKACHSLFPEVQPALLHGDLWGGNFLIASDGRPYLIDPAVYFGHHEVDLAMTRLFGGFDEGFYRAYHEVISLEPDHQQRRDVYQLYYILVHLNLFGQSYKSSAKHILGKYFN